MSDVRGHYRRLPDGQMIWVDRYSVQTGEPLPDEEQTKQ